MRLPWLLLPALYSIVPFFAQADSYTVSLSGTFGAYGVEDASMNAAGQVAGLYVDQLQNVHDFLWTDGKATKFDPQTPCNIGTHNCGYRLFGFNDHGQILANGYFFGNVQSSVYSNGKWQTISGPTGLTSHVVGLGLTNSGEVLAVQFIRNGSSEVAFTSRGGVDSVITTPKGTTNFGPSYINSAGQIAGAYQVAKTSTNVLLTNGKYTSIDYPAGAFSYVDGLTSTGEVYGEYYFTRLSDDHGSYVYSNGKFTVLNPPGNWYPDTVYFSGSDSIGDIYGSFINKSNFDSGYVYHNGGYQIIRFPGATNTNVTSVNASGEILGFYTDANRELYRTFLYENGVYQTLSFGPIGNDTYGYTLNDAGQIFGSLPDNQFFVATPTEASAPEPATLTLLCAGLAVIAVGIAARQPNA